MKSQIISRSFETEVTEKEIALVVHYANDLRPKQIADIMQINKRTLDSHTDKLRSKLGLKTMAAVVYTFCKNGLIK